MGLAYVTASRQGAQYLKSCFFPTCDLIPKLTGNYDFSKKVSVEYGSDTLSSCQGERDDHKIGKNKYEIF